jgi:hypothetical protein
MLSWLMVLQGLQGGLWALVGLASRQMLPLGLMQALLLCCCWLAGPWAEDACERTAVNPVAGWPWLLLLLWLLVLPDSSSESEKSPAVYAYGSSSWKPLWERAALHVGARPSGCPALPPACTGASTGSSAAEACPGLASALACSWRVLAGSAAEAERAAAPGVLQEEGMAELVSVSPGVYALGLLSRPTGVSGPSEGVAARDSLEARHRGGAQKLPLLPLMP